MGKRILHAITGLPRAGAQRVLIDLIAHGDRDRYPSQVVSLLPRGPAADDIEALGVPVWSAGLQRNAALFFRSARLGAHLRSAAPHIVHTWMYHGDVIGGGLAKLSVPKVPVIWHLHHSTLEGDRRSTRALVAAASVLSKVLPKKIIACAESAKQVHVDEGYDSRKMVVIPNGVDAERYRPRSLGPRPLLEELGLVEPVYLIGLVARFHPHKDHTTFLEAALRLLTHRKDVHFVLCGEGVNAGNPAFSTIASNQNIHLLGERGDVDALIPQFDICGLSSINEACPLVLLESMASAVPCVTTDVGDSARLVADTGRIVPPKRPEVLAATWREVLDMSTEVRARLGDAARARVLAHYTLAQTARAIEDVYREVLEE